jgi:hypothetical protein
MMHVVLDKLQPTVGANGHYIFSSELASHSRRLEGDLRRREKLLHPR